MIKKFSVIALLAAFVLSAGMLFLNSTFSNAGYHKRGEVSFILDGAWQKVTITAEAAPSGEIPITGYAVWENTGDYTLNVCEGNTWNADAAFLVLPPGIPRITNVRNPLVHQEGLHLRIGEADAVGTTVSVETWAEY